MRRCRQRLGHPKGKNKRMSLFLGEGNRGVRLYHGYRLGNESHHVIGNKASGRLTGAERGRLNHRHGAGQAGPTQGRGVIGSMDVPKI